MTWHLLITKQTIDAATRCIGQDRILQGYSELITHPARKFPRLRVDLPAVKSSLPKLSASARVTVHRASIYPQWVCHALFSNYQPRGAGVRLGSGKRPRS